MTIQNTEIDLTEIAKISFTHGDDVPSVCHIVLKNTNEHKFTAFTPDSKSKLKAEYEALLAAPKS